jgi:Flp pilus assembly protein TadB
MAQTKRKRRTKHRGNAAGTIETRGRTGRPPTAGEKKKDSRDSRVQARERRLNTPPTWRSSAKRAAIASALMFVFLMLTSRGGAGQRLVLAFVFAVGAFGLYSALGFYMDQYLYRRRIRKREAGQ